MKQALLWIAIGLLIFFIFKDISDIIIPYENKTLQTLYKEKVITDSPSYKISKARIT